MKADHGSYAILPAERDSNHMVPLSVLDLSPIAGGSDAGNSRRPRLHPAQIDDLRKRKII